MEEPVSGAEAPPLWRRWARTAGVDRAVAFGVLSIGLKLASGPVTAFLIALRFTPEMQGYHYTFGSVVALQMLVELGLGQVLVQFASHEAAKLTLGKDGRLDGEADAVSRLVSLGRVAFAWYGAGGVLIAAGLAAAGMGFFRGDSGLSWSSPWIALSLVTGLRFPLLACWSLLEGCHQIARMNAYRAAEAALGVAVTWAAVLSGAGLWTAASASASALLLSLGFLSTRYPAFLPSFRRPPSGPRIDWRGDVWPMQWRLALSWLAGYLSFSLFTPVLYRTHGAVVAGQMGMTWSFVGALTAVASAWVNTKVPAFGRLIAERRFEELDRLYARTAAASFIVAVGLGSALLFGVWLIGSWGHPLSRRLLPLQPTAILILATVLMQISIPQSAYLRAHKREPYLGLSLLSGALIAASTVFLGEAYGPLGMAGGYLAVVALVILPVGTALWARYRRQWHRP